MIIRILVTITKKVKGKHRWRSLRFAHTPHSVGVACASRILRTQVVSVVADRIIKFKSPFFGIIDTIFTWESLPGVGVACASRILRWRSRPFRATPNSVGVAALSGLLRTPNSGDGVVSKVPLKCSH